jgi:hypothetical protein
VTPPGEPSPTRTEDARGKLNDLIAATDLTTFYGPIKFASEGDHFHNNTALNPMLIQIQDGQIKAIAPPDSARPYCFFAAAAACGDGGPDIAGCSEGADVMLQLLADQPALADQVILLSPNPVVEGRTGRAGSAGPHSAIDHQVDRTHAGIGE